MASPAPMPSAKIERFLSLRHLPTPLIAFDLDIVGERYRALAECFPTAEIYYAIKANPAPEVIAALAALGAGFDLASGGELELCRGIDSPARRLSFGNTVKRPADIAAAAELGVDLFAFDALGEVEKLARHAPESRVFCRMRVERRAGAEWPLTHKFGCEARMAADLLIEAWRRGLRPVGVSFHVGSQQLDPAAWDVAIAHAAWIFRACARRGLALELLNLGGGLPAHYRRPVPDIADYAEVIDRALAREFAGTRPRILIEPGRYLVGDAGVLRAQVLLVSTKSPHDRVRWVYLDAGRYNGLPETAGERIRYRVRTPREGEPCGPVILAGPSCDSADILYQRSGYELPLDLAIGDAVDFLSAGAYTASYASVAFNGFAPIRSYFL